MDKEPRRKRKMEKEGEEVGGERWKKGKIQKVQN